MKHEMAFGVWVIGGSIGSLEFRPEEAFVDFRTNVYKQTEHLPNF